MRKLQADLDTKMAQRDEMKEKKRLEKEGIHLDDAGSDADDEEEAEGEGLDGSVPMEQDDLFGEGPNAMDIG